MGYKIYRTWNELWLPKNRETEAFKAALKWSTDNGYDDNEATCLNDIALCVDFSVEYYPKKDAFCISYESDRYNDDALDFIDSIAPYIFDGSYIEFDGEDGDNWRWVVKDNKAIEIDHPIEVWSQDAIEVSSLDDAKSKFKQLYENEGIKINKIFAKQIIGLTIKEVLALAEYLNQEVNIENLQTK